LLKIKYLPFKEEVVVGFTVDAIVGTTSVSAVEVSPVVTCVGLIRCGALDNAAGVNDAAMNDPTFIVCVVALENGISIVPLGDTMFIIALDDSIQEDFVLTSTLGDPIFRVAPDDSTKKVVLNDATLTRAVL